MRLVLFSSTSYNQLKLPLWEPAWLFAPDTTDSPLRLNRGIWTTPSLPKSSKSSSPPYPPPLPNPPICLPPLPPLPPPPTLSTPKIWCCRSRRKAIRRRRANLRWAINLGFITRSSRMRAVSVRSHAAAGRRRTGDCRRARSWCWPRAGGAPASQPAPPAGQGQPAAPRVCRCLQATTKKTARAA